MSNFKDIYKGKKVFLTGHSGFKGSWMMQWLELLGADVKGYSLEPSTEPDHLSILHLKGKSSFASICNKENLENELVDFNPDIIFHLAAQPLVRYSYRNPYETYETNVMGTLNILEAGRKCTNLKAILCITTDKVYQNKEQSSGYSEEDQLGGYDPYSSSKACAEILISSYRDSFFNLSNYKEKHNVLLASARGGNVIGGGDWSDDRLIPDIIRASQSSGVLEIRNPKSVRPWQHVLDCLSGYLLLGQHLLQGKKEFAEAWNFGPINEQAISVGEIVNLATLTGISVNANIIPSELHETNFLRLNCNKALNNLLWKPLLDDHTMFEWTFDWYQHFYNGKVLTIEQITAYSDLAKANHLTWAE